MYLPTTHLHHRRQNLQFRVMSFGLRQVITLTSAFIHGIIHHQQSMKSPTQQQTASISSDSHSLQAIQTLSSVGGRIQMASLLKKTLLFQTFTVKCGTVTASSILQTVSYIIQTLAPLQRQSTMVFSLILTRHTIW